MQMNIFKDSNGKRVKSGDIVLIESTYGDLYGQGQKCEVLWDEACGQYAYRYHAGGRTGTTDFAGVHRFVKCSPADGNRAVLRRALISRYSGDESRDFWNAVNALPRRSRGELYSLGVALQNLEGFVLKRLADEGL